MPHFLEAVSPTRAREILSRFPPLERRERLAAADALGRVLAADILCDQPYPAFDRALMDGYAVRAQDTFGASESAPAYLALSGRIAMGQVAPSTLAPATAQEISTGGPLPQGADAVVMVEYCREVGREQVEVTRPVAPGENLIRRGEDLAQGEVVIRAGTRLEPKELLALAALGKTQIEVFAKPRVGLLATGDELVSPEVTPGPGQVRDANTAALAAQVLEAGGTPRSYGIAPDDPARLREAVGRMLGESDLVLLSGGSSQGARDTTLEVLQGFGPPGVLAHGIAVAPGKPTVLAQSGKKPLIGLPGHPVSSLVIFRIFVHPLIRLLGGDSGAREPLRVIARARLSRSVASKPGREDYVRVALRGDEAVPLLGGSGAIRSVLGAEGLVVIPLEKEGLSAGEEVEVLLF